MSEGILPRSALKYGVETMLLSKVRAACAAISELQLDYAKAGMKKEDLNLCV
jgi:hypothetical protein